MFTAECRWGAVAEVTMGRAFDAWIVHNHHDFGQLKRLCKDIGARAPLIVISSFDVPLHNIPEHARVPSSVAPCLLDLVTCNDPDKRAAVMNQIIDMVRLMTCCEIALTLWIHLHCKYTL